MPPQPRVLAKAGWDGASDALATPPSASGGLASSAATRPVGVEKMATAPASLQDATSLAAGDSSAGASSYTPANAATTGLGPSAYGGAASSLGGGYGANRYGGIGVGAGYPSTYGSSMYGGSGMYGSSYGGYGGGGFGSGYGGYGGYSRYGMGGMGGMGMGGMGGPMGEQPFAWLHSIQNFTSSLSYLTELLGMNTQAISFFIGNAVGVLEYASNSLASLQPWREFPPGHPRHGEAPPTAEEERKRLSRVRILRWVVGLLATYVAFRLLRGLHRLLNPQRLLTAPAPLSLMQQQQQQQPLTLRPLRPESLEGIFRAGQSADRSLPFAAAAAAAPAAAVDFPTDAWGSL